LTATISFVRVSS